MGVTPQETVAFSVMTSDQTGWGRFYAMTSDKKLAWVGAML